MVNIEEPAKETESTQQDADVEAVSQGLSQLSTGQSEGIPTQPDLHKDEKEESDEELSQSEIPHKILQKKIPQKENENFVSGSISESRYTLFKRTMAAVFKEVSRPSYKVDELVSLINNKLPQEDMFGTGEAQAALGKLDAENTVMLSENDVWRI